MTKKYFSVLSMLILAVLMVAIPVVYAQTSPGDITDEPDKNMTKTHESFVPALQGFGSVPGGSA